MAAPLPRARVRVHCVCKHQFHVWCACETGGGWGGGGAPQGAQARRAPTCAARRCTARPPRLPSIAPAPAVFTPTHPTTLHNTAPPQGPDHEDHFLARGARASPSSPPRRRGGRRRQPLPAPAGAHAPWGTPQSRAQGLVNMVDSESRPRAPRCVSREPVTRVSASRAPRSGTTVITNNRAPASWCAGALGAVGAPGAREGRWPAAGRGRARRARAARVRAAPPTRGRPPPPPPAPRASCAATTTTNLILEDSSERVYSTKAGVEVIPLGLYVIRGDNLRARGAGRRGGGRRVQRGRRPPARTLAAARRGGAAPAARAPGSGRPPRVGWRGARACHARAARARPSRIISNTAPPGPCPSPSAVVGEVDEEADSALDMERMRAPPLKAIMHG